MGILLEYWASKHLNVQGLLLNPDLFLLVGVGLGLVPKVTDCHYIYYSRQWLTVEMSISGSTATIFIL